MLVNIHFPVICGLLCSQEDLWTYRNAVSFNKYKSQELRELRQSTGICWRASYISTSILIYQRTTATENRWMELLVISALSPSHACPPSRNCSPIERPQSSSIRRKEKFISKTGLKLIMNAVMNSYPSSAKKRTLWIRLGGNELGDVKTPEERREDLCCSWTKR